MMIKVVVMPMATTTMATTMTTTMLQGCRAARLQGSNKAAMLQA